MTDFASDSLMSFSLLLPPRLSSSSFSSFSLLPSFSHDFALCTRHGMPGIPVNQLPLFPPVFPDQRRHAERQKQGEAGRTSSCKRNMLRQQQHMLCCSYHFPPVPLSCCLFAQSLCSPARLTVSQKICSQSRRAGKGARKPGRRRLLQLSCLSASECPFDSAFSSKSLNSADRMGRGRRRKSKIEREESDVAVSP